MSTQTLGPVTRTAQEMQIPLAGDAIKPPSVRDPITTALREPFEVGFAGGGVPAETPEQLMARMTATYGAPSGSAKTVTPAAPPAPRRRRRRNNALQGGSDHADWQADRERAPRSWTATAN